MWENKTSLNQTSLLSGLFPGHLRKLLVKNTLKKKIGNPLAQSIPEAFFPWFLGLGRFQTFLWGYWDTFTSQHLKWLLWTSDCTLN
jgi:hypothetical protein